MTTDKKNAISSLTKAQCTAIIEFAYLKKPNLHKVSQRAFRAIIGEVGHRDRIQKNREGKPIGHWCDSSLDQLAEDTGFEVGAVRDALWLATTVGVVHTVKRGGKNTATKRTIDTDAMLLLLNELCAEYPHLSNEDWRGFWRNKRGTTPDKRGADTAHLISTQDIYKETRNTNALPSGAIGNALLSPLAECDICDGTGFKSLGVKRTDGVRPCVCRKS
jgi:hypothetical protein